MMDTIVCVQCVTICFAARAICPFKFSSFAYSVYGSRTQAHHTTDDLFKFNTRPQYTFSWLYLIRDYCAAKGIHEIEHITYTLALCVTRACVLTEALGSNKITIGV